MLSIMLKGIIIGIANIIPGVSGGTMAVVFNIYQPLVQSLDDLTKNWRKSVVFLVPLGIGGGIGILLFSKLIKYLLAYHTEPTNFFFIGLILGTCPLIWRKATREKIRPSSYLPLVIAFGIVIISDRWLMPDSGSSLITALSPANFALLFFSGIIGASAMIIPGVSGSFVLLLLGVYHSVLTAIADFNIPVLIPVACGILIGIIATSKLINYLLYRYTQKTYFAITGFMVASIFSIYPGFSFGSSGLLSLLALIIGGLIAGKMQ